jgi:protein-S-isoprenylcysteine O-methyltransferase Ste14
MPQTRTHLLELKIPPLALLLIVGAMMWLAARAAPSLRFTFRGQVALSVVVVIAGVLISISGIATFLRAKTTINPMSPAAASALVTSGIYKLTRNPMYLGLAVILTGWMLWLANVLPFAFIAGFVFYLNRFQIAPEERTLEALFGREFSEYRAKVRRWL